MRQSPSTSSQHAVPSDAPAARHRDAPAAPGGPRRFEFERDSFAFPNELIWEYRPDPATGRMRFSRREPKPDYAHRCFVLARAARQFLYHARFESDLPAADGPTFRRLIREVVSRNPRTPCSADRQVVFPGYPSLRSFSAAQESLLKAEGGGAWRSYVLRSHWRMIFPISRVHQARTARRLVAAIQRGWSPVIHLVRFPQLTINHGMVLFAVAESPSDIEFQAYDPNDPSRPTMLTFNSSRQTFVLPANHYWAGGPLNVIEIFRGWWM